MTDSEAFLYAVKNKDSYEKILDLFKAGVLKVSRYGNKRTASQYMQEAIEKCNEPNKNAFLFSGVPVLCTEHDLLEKMRWALQYSDVGILEELMEKEENPKERERLDYIVRFVRMILVMSMEELASNPVKSESGKSFMQFFNLVCEWLGSGIGLLNSQADEEDWKCILPDALKLLEQIKKELQNEQDAQKLMDNRTNWVNKINAVEKSDAACLAEAIVDLCYNYTVEESICRVSKHYLSEDIHMFQKDFCKRLTEYWKQYRLGIHEFCKGDEEAQNEYNIKLPPWDTAVRLVQEEKKRKRRNIKAEKQDFKPLYEQDYAKEQKKWNRRIAGQMWLRLRTAIVYIILFCGVDYGMGWIEDVLTGAFGVSLWDGVMQLLWSVGCSTVAFGIIGSKVAEWFNLPDILESVKSIAVGIKDLRRIVNAPKNVAYHNMK